MKIKIILVSIIVAFSSISCSNAQRTEFSKEALAEKITTIDNNQIAFQEVIDKHKGKAIIIDVWASWCGDCIKSMPETKELQVNNPDVSFVFISLDKNVKKWESGIEKYELTGDHYLAEDGMRGSFGKAIDLDWIPRYIIIDKTGKVVIYRAVETDFEKINTTLKSLK